MIDPHLDINEFTREFVVPRMIKQQEARKDLTDKDKVRLAILSYCSEPQTPPRIIEADHHLEEIFGKALAHLLPTMSEFAVSEIKKAQEHWMNSPMNPYN